MKIYPGVSLNTLYYEKEKNRAEKLSLNKQMIGDLSRQQQNKVAGGATGRRSCVTYRIGTKCCMDPV